MEFYHVLNRGVEKKDIVIDDSDRFRFVHSLFIFNDAGVADPNHTRGDYLKSAVDRDCLVHIHAWCLMNNHYHLLLSPIHDDPKNLSLFMKKLNMGYAKYFNEKYNRSGYLWQGKYKKVLVQRDSQFMYIPYYIHLNPLDYQTPEWRQGKVKNFSKAVEILNNYRWSSYLDYSGHKNFPSTIYKDLLTKILGKPNKSAEETRSIITTKRLAEASSLIE